MRWIATPSKDTATVSLEKRLWAAADELRANSGLTAAQYSQPVLGLIFLRFADAKFAARRASLEKAATGRRGSRVDDTGSYHAAGVLFLPPEARFDELLEFPEGGKKNKTLGQAVDDAMRAIERENPQLSGVLPKSYQVFNARLLKELLKNFSMIPVDLEGDSFGRIYEYFLAEFAMNEGAGGGQFYTPAAIVRLMVEMLEPYRGRVLDPACGSGGMFVQSANFVRQHRIDPKTNGGGELSIHGVEKVDDTGRLCRLNLAVHGLEGDIRHGGEINSYYDDPHEMVGSFDFVLANPPFNVDKVDKDRIKDAVGPGRRFPFGIPKPDNANYLWIQLFYSALSPSGRAGFVMANSASDARSSELELRRAIIEARAVDVMVSVGPNMFYTVTLPCTLWFLDRGKAKSKRKDQVLFLDARHVYRQVDRAHRDWTSEQIGFLANVVRLYRGEEPDLAIGGAEAREKLHEVFGRKLKYSDVLGLCRVASVAEIQAQNWSLSPARYVGVVPGEELGDEDFRGQFQALNEELERLNVEARALEKRIAKNAAEILGS
jgi:type I restriction enzyme M protein